jgi:hypothetical protein
MNDEDWVGKDLPVGSMTPANPTRLEQARLFLQFRVADALSADEVRESSFRNLSPGMVAKHRESLEALEWLANETPDGVSLVDVVQWDANRMIDDEQEARVWLLEFAEFVRDILGDQAPPRQYPIIVEGPRAFFFPQRD